MLLVYVFQLFAHYKRIGNVPVIKRCKRIKYIELCHIFSADIDLLGRDLVIENFQVIHSLLYCHSLYHVVYHNKILRKIRYHRLKDIFNVSIGLHVLNIPLKHVVKILYLVHQ